MTDRATDPATLHTRLCAWVHTHDTTLVPAHVAIRLGTLRALDALMPGGGHFLLTARPDLRSRLIYLPNVKNVKSEKRERVFAEKCCAPTV